MNVCIGNVFFVTRKNRNDWNGKAYLTSEKAKSTNNTMLLRKGLNHSTTFTS